jgi:hypothetical protein
MSYRLYLAPAGSAEPSPLEWDTSLYKEFQRLDEALGFARHTNDGNRVAILIIGDDGTRMNRREIAAALSQSTQNIPERRTN